ncbi:DNA polymerase III subunit delta [Aerococcaceae bacterium DSM 111020]|nr:DNA polymerase III subunit delta [Aerococcaceae bacterium DSM 111020]
MNYQAAIQALHQNKIAPIYTLHGTESYLRDSFIQEIMNKVEEMDAGEVDVTYIDLKDQSIAEMIDEANMYSFFSQFRIVIIADIDVLIGSSATKLSQSNEKMLLEYLSQPNPNTILIFNHLSDQMDKRRKLTKQLMKETAFIDISQMNEQGVARYLQDYLSHSNLKLSKEAIQTLLMRTDYQLTAIMTELNKLEAYAISGNTITVDVIKQLVPRTLESDVFELSNAVVDLNIDKAVQIYQDLILNQHEPIALHGLLIAQFRLFIQVRLLASQGFLEGDIAKQLSVHPYRVKLALQNNRKIPYDVLIELYDEMAEIDFNLKQGIGVKETYFYLLLTKLNEKVKQKR